MQNSQDTSLSTLHRIANFSVPIAQDPEFHINFLISYLQKLWTKHHYMDIVPFHCTCLENPCSILELLKSLGILKADDMELFLQRMGFCLSDYFGNTNLNSEESTKSSGHIKKMSKSPKNSRNGKISR